jgi:hypothetical protein
MEIVKPGDPLSPVAVVNIGPVPSAGAILIRFDYLSHPDQPVDQAHKGLNYALTPIQARYVVQKIGEALELLKSFGVSGRGDPGN